MDVFAVAEQAEVLVGRIYKLLAERFGANRELQRLFAALAREEEIHAARVRQVASEWRQDRSWQPSRDLLRVAELADMAAGMLNSVSAMAELSAEEAVEIAGKLEDQFSEVHAQILASEGAPQLAALFAELATHDGAHNELIELRRRLAGH